MKRVTEPQDRFDPMSVSPSFRTFALDQLGRCVPSVRARSMFGGVGIYAGELFFALIADDTVYFKVDDQTRRSSSAAAWGPSGPRASTAR